MKSIDFFKNLSPLKAIFVASLLLGVIVWLDWSIKNYISLSIFYLVPISLATWFAGRFYGFFLSSVSSFLWWWANLSDYPMNVSLVVYYWNTGVRFSCFLLTTYLLSELQQSFQREKELARTDFLTEVANLRFFFEFANLEIKRAQRYRYCLTIAYLDVDNFKCVNDQFGHKIGDKLLKNVAQTIKLKIRSTDLIARMGGDEFAILMPETSYEQAQIVLDRIQKSLLETMQENQWKVTFSIGVATFIKSPNSVEDLIERADNLMYYAKHNGKNMVKHERIGDVQA